MVKESNPWLQDTLDKFCCEKYETPLREISIFSYIENLYEQKLICILGQIQWKNTRNNFSSQILLGLGREKSCI